MALDLQLGTRFQSWKEIKGDRAKSSAAPAALKLSELYYGEGPGPSPTYWRLAGKFHSRSWQNVAKSGRGHHSFKNKS